MNKNSRSISGCNIFYNTKRRQSILNRVFSFNILIKIQKNNYMLEKAKDAF